MQMGRNRQLQFLLCPQKMQMEHMVANTCPYTNKSVQRLIVVRWHSLKPETILLENI